MLPPDRCPHKSRKAGISGGFVSRMSAATCARSRNHSSNVNNEALPPAAVVLMVSVRSVQKRAR